jgi:uncharacterized protein YmfQ (DUF2313 family)
MKATDKEYYQQQQDLLPVGFAWNREPEGIVNRILAGLALAWARIHGRALALVEEADPQTARETLAEWEENLGLPDECTANTATTLQERRAAVVEKYVTKGDQSVARFYELAQDLGYEVTIKEHRPFICGISRCGASGDVLNGGHEVRFVFTVTPHGPRLTRFRCGVSAAPERLCKITRAADLECRLRKSAYAHVLPMLNYEEITI